MCGQTPNNGFGCSCPGTIDLNADVSFSKNGKFEDIISNYTMKFLGKGHSRSIMFIDLVE